MTINVGDKDFFHHGIMQFSNPFIIMLTMTLNFKFCVLLTRFATFEFLNLRLHKKLTRYSVLYIKCYTK